MFGIKKLLNTSEILTIKLQTWVKVNIAIRVYWESERSYSKKTN